LFNSATVVLTRCFKLLSFFTIILLTATDQKPQKSLKRRYYPPSHRLNVNVMLINITFLMIFLRVLIRRR